VPTWTDGKNARSRRTIPIDPTAAQQLGANRSRQAEERLAGGSTWVDNDLRVASRTGTVVSEGNFDQTLERLVARAGVPRLASHGLRHTAATHMVRHASGIGEIPAADLLGHSPDILTRTYAHALSESVRTVTTSSPSRRGLLTRQTSTTSTSPSRKRTSSALRV
jgi:integrase